MSKISLTNIANLQNETTVVNAINANNTTVTTAFDNTLSRDGTSPNQMGANLDMNSNRIINLPAPVSTSEAVRLQDLSTFSGGGTINTVPAGGTTGQMLAKSSNTDYAMAWTTTPGVTGTVLTLNNDTNVTLAGTGAATALVNAASITAGWTGNLSVARGGTGAGTLTAHGVIVGEGTSALAATAAGTSGQLLIGQGASADPSFNTVSGDVTIGNTGVTAIGAGKVTNTQLANMAASTIKGNNTGISGQPLDLSQTQLTALVNNFGSGVAGAVPASGGGTTNFLRADGSWVSPSSSGNLILLNTIAVSGASVSDTTSFTASYNTYEIIFENIIPATNNVTLEFQVHSGGAFKATGYRSSNFNATSGGASGVDTSTTYIPLSGASSTFNGAPGMSGSIRVSNPATSAIHPVWGDVFHATTATGGYRVMVGGYWNTAGVVDGFQVLASSGNLTSGTIRVYGIA